jgi:hypothetical protein
MRRQGIVRGELLGDATRALLWAEGEACRVERT